MFSIWVQALKQAHFDVQYLSAGFQTGTFWCSVFECRLSNRHVWRSVFECIPPPPPPFKCTSFCNSNCFKYMVFVSSKFFFNQQQSKCGVIRDKHHYKNFFKRQNVGMLFCTTHQCCAWCTPETGSQAYYHSDSTFSNQHLLLCIYRGQVPHLLKPTFELMFQLAMGFIFQTRGKHEWSLKKYTEFHLKITTQN